ncbi:Rha family transcriptional regulator [Campylobacter sp. IFREMER_LSEM_CL1097]|uniref:Rha family transcriptional regulator n=1 Tax=Campylobacter sp. IFREMER_LSEM_CL1097 TaxID=2911613 RepID=UPI0021E6A389|nr:Rha family transcriptional regulator [Campylobacter sp. IFREMER_LSEM_CL1097]MCV3442894.1 Rha family transcriptional regulator [Campylobacter sp. IFREMER_LSEM_CL1097]
MEKLAVINGVGVELEVANDQVTTTSLSVAAVFNKRHDNIIAKINELPQDEFNALNFKAVEYKDKKGELRPCYNLTRDGFSLLVMGFTGEKAYKFKVEFIKAFNEMEKCLKNLEQEQMQKLAFRQSLGYKSQLKQQKLKYENEIKALKYDLEHKNELSFKRKLSNEELLELRKFLAKDYEIVCFKKWEYMLFAESVSRKNYKLDKANGFCIYKSIEEKFNSRLDYYKHYDEYEEKWGNLLRR